MKKIHSILLILFVSTNIFITSCTDVVSIDVKPGLVQLSVDAFINNLQQPQVVKLNLTQNYFDNSTPKPALGATVYLFAEDSTRFDFVDKNNNGNYIWTPKANQTFGQIGKQYALYVKYDNEEFVSVSKMNRVPKIDSVAYEYLDARERQTTGPKEGYRPEFYARDFTGFGDCYWIRSAKNGKYFSLSSQIVVAYDAAMNPGSGVDGLVFIRPLRQSVATELFADKDTLQVDVYSISQETYYLLRIVQAQAQNAGIFATPTSNTPSNIVNRNTKSTKTAIGFFNVSAVSSVKTIIDKTKARPKT